MDRRKFIATTLAATTTVSVPAKSFQPVATEKSFTVKAGEDRFMDPLKYRGVNPNLVKVSAKDTGGRLSVFEYEGFVKMGPELHLHFDQDEIFYVVDGEFLFQVGNERKTLKAGDTIFLPRNIAHTWLQLSDKGKLIYLLQEYVRQYQIIGFSFSPEVVLPVKPYWPRPENCLAFYPRGGDTINRGNRVVQKWQSRSAIIGQHSYMMDRQVSTTLFFFRLSFSRVHCFG